MAEEVNILVIEDNEESAKKLERILEGISYYKVWFIPSPKEAVNMVKTKSFAVVLTELRMPYMNGVEVTKKVLSVSPATSIVVMTPYTFISSAVEAMEAGAYGYITKPFNPSEIKIVLERAVERYSMMLKEDSEEYYMGLSVKDGLTGVYNRRFMGIQMKSTIATLQKEREKKFSILLIDIDNFKNYNDTQGHLAGDQLLRRLTELVRKSVRDKDIIFRYGGEEFVVLLDGANKKEAKMIGERTRTLVELYAPTTISIGVATFPDDGENEKDLIDKADGALYEAKRTGKNKVCVA
jgi:diguanylate cyclase (GGDEF)-like protein